MEMQAASIEGHCQGRSNLAETVSILDSPRAKAPRDQVS